MKLKKVLKNIFIHYNLMKTTKSYCLLEKENTKQTSFAFMLLELVKLDKARKHLYKNGIFDCDSFFELITEST